MDIHPLASCVAKLNRAELHAKEFLSEVRKDHMKLSSTIKFYTPNESQRAPSITLFCVSDC
jgi:hypothetical protein